MKIALIVGAEHSVPPRGTAAIHTFAGVLAKGLLSRGHEVLLYASGDSTTPATLKSILDKSLSAMTPADNPCRPELSAIGDVPQNVAMLHGFWAVGDALRSKVDVIHTNDWYFVRAPWIVSLPFVHSIHHGYYVDDNPLCREKIFLQEQGFPNMQFVAVSQSQRNDHPESLPMKVVHNAIDYSAFAVGRGPRDYLLFLGRINPLKGPHLAIAAAKRIGLPLKIAGPVFDQGQYFAEEIQPHIDGKNVIYVGEVNHAEKVALYGGAKALLFSSTWKEPFGLTILEAMACGTPVIALRGGAAEEIVKEGVSGYLAKDIDEMVEKARLLDRLTTNGVHAYVTEGFSVDRMAKGYEDAYQAAIDNYRPIAESPPRAR